MSEIIQEILIRYFQRTLLRNSSQLISTGLQNSTLTFGGSTEIYIIIATILSKSSILL
jgi:hypothetical protein